MHNPKNAYQQSDTKVIVEYEQEADLFNACEHAVYFNTYKIIGTPRGYPCWIYNKKPLVKPPVEIPQHHYCNAKPAPSQDFKTHSIVAQKQDEHYFNAPLDTLKDLKPTSLTQPSDQIAPEHVHPDRLRNFIHPTVSPQATSTYTSEIDSYPQN